MKTCNRCEEEKELTEFAIRKDAVDGRRNICKVCTNIKTTERLKDPEAMKRKKAATKKYEQANKKTILAKKQQYREDNKEWYEAYHSKYRKENKEDCNARVREWSINNRDKEAAKQSKRRAIKLKATPSWSELSEIEDLFLEASKLYLVTGDKYHIDHIIPLQGKTVCGLHVLSNLQILEATENLIKGNKFESERL